MMAATLLGLHRWSKGTSNPTSPALENMPVAEQSFAGSGCESKKKNPLKETTRNVVAGSAPGCGSKGIVGGLYGTPPRSPAGRFKIMGGGHSRKAATDTSE
eukprot:SAG31_NODE_11146_length_1061_cov_0.950104_2_plen_100_part_01